MAALCKALQVRLSVYNVLNTQVRYRRSNRPLEIYPENMSWTKPIYELQEQKMKEEKENKQEPAMLHMVWRVKKLAGRPYWEKDVLKMLKLDGKMFQVQIHKNTPEVNDMLKFVKHLIEIKPITFPYGLPTDETDYEHCLLQDNGEFVVTQKLNGADTDEIKVVDKPEKIPENQMDLETIKADNRNKLESFSLMSEYFQANYEYKYNQDKKEYRYNGDHNIGAGRDWY
ncbi:uncharacterized protein LOC126829258 [Patella vulgata]|uniref:uncharacterized protein LOC126829258 n=1 Tax=Patella vulgata TaxID=6465 RepID=UPI00217F49F3|nr:uncharacterized protein LOC126829258 [Patella vulgata]